MAVKSTPTGDRARRFRRALLRWFRRHGRDLPWRATRDPWAILVSEFMLQQTQVSRVEAFYPRFLAAFPTIESLAASPPRAVVAEWDGLGYYRRARNLHRLARQVVREHGARIPREVDQLQALPGVGLYTAGAVACFAYERAVPAVDTNVARVIRRAFHPRLGTDARAQRRIRVTAKQLLPRAGRGAWALNQGLMELGALVCTARVAKCGECPVNRFCATGRRKLTAPRSAARTVGGREVRPTSDRS